MKKSCIGLAVMFVCSCASIPPPTLEKEFEVRALDLTQYASEDFLISPNMPGIDYITLAYIAVDGRNGVVWVNKTVDNIPNYESEQDEASLEQVISAAVSAAKNIGADALVNVQWHPGYDSINPPSGADWGGIQRGKIQIEGWAIKRNSK